MSHAFHEQQQILWLDTPKGTGRLLWVINDGPDSEIQYVVVITGGEYNRQIWTFSNREVLVAENQTMGLVKLNP